MISERSEFEKTMIEIWDALVPAVGAGRAHQLLAKLRSCLPKGETDPMETLRAQITDGQRSMTEKCPKCGLVAELGSPSCDAEAADRFYGFMRFHECKRQLSTLSKQEGE